MAFTLEDVLDSVRASRRFFLKHLVGLRDPQWDWKPYAECKSIRETLAHMSVNDRAALTSLETGEEPEETALRAQEQECLHQYGHDLVQLRARLEDSFTQLLAFVQQRYADAPLDVEIGLYGDRRKLASGIAYLCAEDFYHAGQVAFIRLATDPDWDYYGAVYG